MAYAGETSNGQMEKRIYPWSQGKPLAWDFTCRDSLATSYTAATSVDAGKAAKKAEKEKLDHYKELERSHIVMPVACETMGSWAPMALDFIKELGSRIGDITGDKRWTSYLFQSMGLHLHGFPVVPCGIWSVPDR